MKRLIGSAVIVLAALAGIVACDSGSSGGSAGVSVYLTDAPLDLAGVSAVNVTIREVVLYPRDDEDSGGIDLEEGPISLPGDLTLNLLDFRNGAVTFVGAASVPSGPYTRIRLEVVSAELVRDDDGDPATPEIVEPIVVPSGKVDVPVPFELTEGENLELTLDFDAQASVMVNTTNGKNDYLLRPVINLAGMKSSKP